MSIFNIEEVKCVCGEVFEAELISAISIADNPELKDHLLNGMINLAQCPKCSEVFYEDRFILYHDSKDEFIAFVYPLICKSEYQKYREKMLKEFGEAKKFLEKEHKINYKPVLFFGIDALVQAIRDRQDMEDEEMVAEHICRDLGLDTFQISPSFARENEIPRIIPIEKNKKEDKFIIPALDVLIKYNPNLISYIKLNEKLSKNLSLINEIIKEKK
ncbi:MAG: CpXC domain-containing protein [Elusimicrobiota bacterium]|jgi:hypothetical protein|nr:CpXC domain-containing protein [Elusimicrobiota bacterium]